jgi:hypothetical protein
MKSSKIYNIILVFASSFFLRENLSCYSKGILSSISCPDLERLFSCASIYRFPQSKLPQLDAIKSENQVSIYVELFDNQINLAL